METQQKLTHPIIETRTQYVKLPNDISVEATFDGHDREASRLVITTMTSRVVFASKETVRMFTDCISGLRYFGLDAPLTNAEVAERDAKDAARKVVAS